MEEGSLLLSHSGRQALPSPLSHCWSGMGARLGMDTESASSGGILNSPIVRPFIQKEAP